MANRSALCPKTNVRRLSVKHTYQMQHLCSFRACGWSVRNFLKVQSNPEDPVIRDCMLTFPCCTQVCNVFKRAERVI